MPKPAAVRSYASAGRAWRSVDCPAQELNLDVTLACGQSFRWRRQDDEAASQLPHWAGVHDDRVWLLRRPDSGRIEYQVYPDDCSDAVERLNDYLRLRQSLAGLYAGWSASDPVFRSVCRQFPGVRLLRQCPLENLFSFICSSNNNIARISQLVQRLCENFGQPLCTVDGQVYHRFPQVSALCGPDVEPRLRSLGFGYRARYVAESARRLRDLGGPDWLAGLRQSPPGEARRRLAAEFSGVGRKVADCVCLMSLDQLDTVPVDVHVMRIARTLYGVAPAAKGLSEAAYAAVSGFFPTVWRPHAGWAHAVLFSADLGRFQHLRVAEASTPAAAEVEAPAKPASKAAPSSGRRKRKAPAAASIPE